MKIGIDSYCYHRFFGEIYPQQTPPARRMTVEDFVIRAHELGVDGVSLEACFFPDYSSEYYLHINGDSFYFRPKTIYPLTYVGQKLTYHITKQNLTLAKKSYAIGETIIGYVNVEFIETVSIPGEAKETHKFYLRGFIKTPLKQGIQNGR